MDKKLALELKIKKLELQEQELAEKKRHEAEQHRLAVLKMEIKAEELAAKKAALLSQLDNDKDPEPPSDPEPEPEKPEKPENNEPAPSNESTEDKPETIELNPDDPQTDELEERSLEHMQEVEEAAKEPLPSFDLFDGKNPQEMTDEDLDAMFDNVVGGVVDEARNSLTSPLDFLEQKKGA